MSKVRHITLPAGFVAAGVKAGIKASGREDLAIIAGVEDCAAAVATTQNQVIGEPVRYIRNVLPKGYGVLRGIVINGRDMTVKNEAVFLFTQAKNAYIQSLKLDNSFWDARHNLDRILMILPDDPSPGVGDSDSPGLIMGNIPVGLP